MRLFFLAAGVALALGGCTPTMFGETMPLDQVRASFYPMSRDVWRVSVRSDGQVERDIVERAGLYHAADLTIKRGFERFIVQSTGLAPTPRGVTQTLRQGTEVAGAAANMAVPGVGGLVAGSAGTIVGSVDQAFTIYGGELVIRMFKADDPNAGNALDATEVLNENVNALRRRAR
jgi:hypothetical protein